VRKQLPSSLVLFLLGEWVVHDIGKFFVERLRGNANHPRVLRVMPPLRPEGSVIREAGEWQNAKAGEKNERGQREASHMPSRIMPGDAKKKAVKL
jgi:hypothetical protein